MTFPLGAPLLDACVLAVLEKEDAYGYLGVYAPRQRGVQPASTNRPSHISHIALESVLLDGSRR